MVRHSTQHLPLEYGMDSALNVVRHVAEFLGLDVVAVLQANDGVVRALYAAYYTPLILVVLTGVCNVLLHISFGAVFPLLQHTSVDVLDTLGLADIAEHSFRLAKLLVPHSCVAVCLIAFGFKFTKAFGEACVDAGSRYDGTDYALTMTMLTFLLETPIRIAVLGAVAFVMASCLGVVLFTDTVTQWAQRDPHVLFATWAIVTAQLVFAAVTSVDMVRRHRRRRDQKALAARNARRRTSGLDSSSEESLSDSLSDSSESDDDLLSPQHPGLPIQEGNATQALVAKWWRRHIGRIRHNAIQMLFVFFLVVSATRGPIDALEHSFETLLYLNLPHVASYTVLSAAVSCARALQAPAWLLRHPEFIPAVFAVVTPFVAIFAVAAAYFRNVSGVVVLATVAVALLLVRAINMCRAYDVGPHGRVCWTSRPSSVTPAVAARDRRRRGVASPANFDPGTPRVACATELTPQLALVLESAYEQGWTKPSVVALEVTVDLQAMRLTQKATGAVKLLDRMERPGEFIPPGPLAAVRDLTLRIILLESEFAFSGHRFRVVRRVLKLIYTTLSVIVLGVVFGAILQETVEALQPVPIGHKTYPAVGVTGAPADIFELDHLVIKLKVLVPRNLSASPDDAALSKPSGPRHDPAVGCPTSDGNELGPLCFHHSHAGTGVSAYELSWLSAVSYLDDRASVLGFLRWFNYALGVDWELRYPGPGDSGPSRRPGEQWTSLVEVFSPSRNSSVVSVRGTDFTSMYDMLQDISLYAESFLFQALSHVLPGAASLPSSLVADLIDFSAAVERMTMPGPVTATGDDLRERHYHAVVERHVRGMIARDLKAGIAAPGSRIVMAGHSLGGAVGHIVAAAVGGGVTSFGLHSPGVLLPRKKLGIHSAAVDRVATTVVASHDIVPKIGWQGGTLLHMQCSDRIRERCHAGETTIVAMWQQCAAIRARYPLMERVWAT